MIAAVFLASAPRWGTADAEIKLLHTPHPMVGAQGYQMLPLSKLVIGRNIALHAVPADRASTNLVSAFPAHSTSFPPKLCNPQGGMCIN